MLCGRLNNLKKVRPVESYVVRIYRRYEAQRDRVIGLVEHPVQGTVEKFSGVNALMNILLTPTQTAEPVAAPEEEKKRANADQ